MDRTLRINVIGAYAKISHLIGDVGAMDLNREAAELEGEDLIPNAYWGPGMLLGRALMWSDGSRRRGRSSRSATAARPR